MSGVVNIIPVIGHCDIYGKAGLIGIVRAFRLSWLLPSIARTSVMTNVDA